MRIIDELRILTVSLLILQAILWLDNIILMITITFLQFLLITINKERITQTVSLAGFLLLTYGTLNVQLSSISILRITACYIVFTLFLGVNDLLKDEKKYYINLSRLLYNMFSVIGMVLLFSTSLILLGLSFFPSQPGYIDIVILIILIVITITLITQISS